MADRSQVLASPAYRALGSEGGRRVLDAVEQLAGRGAVAITLYEFI